jgi:prepilin-type N-terminal cleavage/methylation domain-containing protein
MKRSDRGFTLIEVLISLAVLFIGVTAATSTVIYASRSVSTGLHLEQASTLGQSLLTTLMAVPFTSSGSGNSLSPNTFFTNVTTANDADVADSAAAFAQATLPANAYDHVDTELPANVAAMTATAPPGSISYQRYWNIAPVTKGVIIAVIVRWQDGATWQRTVAVGTRYQP